MPKLSINTTSNYSPNFDAKKRTSKQIKFIVFHYTGMKKEKDAINRLTSFKSKVSSHYFINNLGKIFTLVPDSYSAWHAGISSWKKYKSLNKNSIGIEISNPGHEFNYNRFSKKQINSLIKLSKFLIKKYKIKSNCILAHSDIAPYRKKDPGEKFPWKYLSQNKISKWHDFTQNQLLKFRNLKIQNKDKNKFFQNLFKIGYPRTYKNINSIYLNKLAKAFQRRFRQELINGIVDKECLIISKNLVYKFK